MLPVLDAIMPLCAVYGNHEFGKSHDEIALWSNRYLSVTDFGLEHLITFAKKTKFPWLMSNVFMKDTTVPLGEGKVSHIIEKDGIKVGRKHADKSCLKLIYWSDWFNRTHRGGMAVDPGN